MRGDMDLLGQDVMSLDVSHFCGASTCEALARHDALWTLLVTRGRRRQFDELRFERAEHSRGLM